MSESSLPARNGQHKPITFQSPEAMIAEMAQTMYPDFPSEGARGVLRRVLLPDLSHFRAEEIRRLMADSAAPPPAPVPAKPSAKQPPRRPPQKKRSRAYRHTVKRALETALTLPQIQKHGFTHPSHGHFLMLPPEYDVIQALETKAVAAVILAVLRRTMGVPGDGPTGRKEWVQLSTHEMADATLMPHSKACKGIYAALKKRYIVRRPAGRTWEYAIRWKGTN